MLPVSLTLLDDDACEKGAAPLTKDLGDKIIVRICQCEKGYFIDQSDSKFCGSANCTECTKGMMCRAKDGEAVTAYQNLELQSIRIEPGFYRENSQSSVVVKCPVEGTCAGNEVAGDLLCVEGHSGPMCQVCLVTDEVTYVWSNDRCVPCESSHEGIMYGLLTVVLLLASIVTYCIVQNKFGEFDKLEHLRKRLSRQILTKYKILVKLLQTLCKITTLYPDITLPAVFSQVINKLNIFVDLDINILPFNCVISSANFHDSLLLMTLAPLVCIAFIALVYFYQCNQIRRHYSAAGKAEETISVKLEELKADCIYYVLVFVYTIFSLVSATIIQTFNYDHRLKAVTGESYLIADYTIRQSDADHKAYVVYAAIMFVVYCVGVPAVSLYFLWVHNTNIQELQASVLKLSKLQEAARRAEREKRRKQQRLQSSEDTKLDEEKKEEQDRAIEELEKEQAGLLRKTPMLRGLAPLYQDYDAEHYYFEVIQFVVTLFLVAVAVCAALSPN